MSNKKGCEKTDEIADDPCRIDKIWEFIGLDELDRLLGEFVATQGPARFGGI